MDQGSQRPVFPGGHLSSYLPRSTLLNFSEVTTELAVVATANLLDPNNLVDL